MSLIEVLIVLTLLGLVFAGAFQMFQTFTSGRIGSVTAQLTLQMEARRAFVDLFQKTQEGVEILKPDPGATLPYLMLRDLKNDLLVFYLRKNETASKEENQDLFDLYSVVRDLELGTSSKPRPVLQRLRYLNFTTHGFGAVLITGMMQRKEHKFPFLNMIRLKNLTAEDI